MFILEDKARDRLLFDNLRTAQLVGSLEYELIENVYADGVKAL